MKVKNIGSLATVCNFSVFEAYVSKIKEVGEKATAAARKSPKKPPPKKIITDDAADDVPSRKKRSSVYDEQLDAIFAHADIKKPKADPSLAHATMRAAMRRGEFDPIYWIEAEEIASSFLQAAPTSVAHPNPPPFPYQEPDNMPSFPTYGAGVPSAGPTLYTGATSGGLFRDTLIRWQRITLEVPYPINSNPLTWPVIFLTMQQTIMASDRGVRTAQDCVVMGWIHAPGDIIEQTTIPPVHPDNSINPPDDAKYWRLFYRFKKPASGAPYYSATNYWEAPMRARKIARARGEADQTRITILVAPRPAYGINYAGNTALSSNTVFTVRAWQPNQCAGTPGALKFKHGGLRTVASVPHDSGIPLTPEILAENAYSVEGLTPWKIAKRIINGAASQNPNDWLYLSGHTPPEIKLATTNGAPQALYIGNLGADRAAFTIFEDTLKFNIAPDADAPTDAGLNNTYQTCVKVIDEFAAVGNEHFVATVHYFYNITRIHRPSTISASIQESSWGLWTAPTADAAQALAREGATRINWIPVPMNDGIPSGAFNLVATGWPNQQYPMAYSVYNTDFVSPDSSFTSGRYGLYGNAVYNEQQEWFDSPSQYEGEWSQQINSTFQLVQITDADNGANYTKTENGAEITETFCIITSAKIWPLSGII